MQLVSPPCNLEKITAASFLSSSFLLQLCVSSFLAYQLCIIKFFLSLFLSHFGICYSVHFFYFVRVKENFLLFFYLLPSAEFCWRSLSTFLAQLPPLSPFPSLLFPLFLLLFFQQQQVNFLILHLILLPSQTVRPALVVAAFALASSCFSCCHFSAKLFDSRSRSLSVSRSFSCSLSVGLHFVGRLEI